MRGVKRFFCQLSAVAAAALAVAGCAPKTTNPEQLNVLHKQNMELKQQIADMQASIEQAGEDIPGLQDQINAKEAEITSAIKQLDELNRQETDNRLRAIELQDRLDAFRTAFRAMQNDIANRR